VGWGFVRFGMVRSVEFWYGEAGAARLGALGCGWYGKTRFVKISHGMAGEVW